MFGYRKNKPPFHYGLNVLQAGSIVKQCDNRVIIDQKMAVFQFS